MPFVTASLVEKDKVIELVNRFHDAIESGDQEKVLATQAAFSVEAKVLWEQVESSDLPPKSKAMARYLAMIAMEELPKKVQDPANYPEIQQKLRLLLNTLALIN